MLREAAARSEAVREMNKSLAKFSDSLERMSGSMKPDNLDTMREGFAGLETSLATGADEVERL